MTESSRLRPFLKPLTAGVVALLLLGTATACGDSDDDPENGSAQTAPASDSDTNDDGSAPDKSGSPPQEASGSGGFQSGSPALTGEPEQARRGAKAVDGIYSGINDAVEAGVAATNVNLGDTFEAADSNENLTAICGLMSSAAQRETITYAKRSAGLAGIDWNCERAMGVMLRRSKQSGGIAKTQKAQVVGVNAEGNRATATVRFGGPKARAKTISLVREDGEWKLGGTPVQ